MIKRKIVLQKWRVFPFSIYEGKWELNQKLNTEKITISHLIPKLFKLFNTTFEFTKCGKYDSNTINV